jgi:hypothetical protein
VTSVDQALTELAARLDEAAPELIDAVLARQRAEVPDGSSSTGAPAMVDATGRAAAASLLTAICSGLSNGRRAPAHLPPGAVAQAAAAAASGVAWSTVARTYGVAHAVVWEQLIAEVEASELDAAGRAVVLQVLSRFLFTLVDHVTAELGVVHARELERLVRSGARRRTAIVRDLLAGVPVAEEQLGYHLRAEHLGVIAWGPERERAVVALARGVGLRLLWLDGPADVLWAWIGGDPGIAPAARRALEAAVPPAGTRFALGGVAEGVAGFRATHRQAADAQRVALHGGAAVTRYGDVALEALVLQEPAVALDFARRELGALASADRRSATLRRTLRAYFAAGQNAAAAGAALGVHERTVGYRLQSAADRIGRQVGARPAELVVALRILAALEPAPPPAVAAVAEPVRAVSTAA